MECAVTANFSFGKPDGRAFGPADFYSSLSHLQQEAMADDAILGACQFGLARLEGMATKG
jgi:hypothetical protein